MSTITQLRTIASSLQKGHHLVVKSCGVTRQGPLDRAWRKLSKEGDSHLIKCFNQQGRSFESIPVLTNAASTHALQQQRDIYEAWITAANEVVKTSRVYSKKDRQELCFLQLQIAKLSYRIGKDAGGCDPLTAYDPELLQKVKASAEKWAKQPLRESHTLTTKENEQLEELCRYPLLAKALLPCRKIQDTTYKWLFRDRVPLDVICQYQTILDRLQHHLMIGRVGAFGRKMLTVDIDQLKNLHILIEGKKVPLTELNKGDFKTKKILLSNGDELTLEQIFKDFLSKRELPGELEFFWEGIRPWHIYRWGPKIHGTEGEYASIDSLKAKYWKQFPIFDKRTKQELEEKYKIKFENDSQCLGIIGSTRQYANLGIEKNHGYTIIFIPDGKGFYDVFPFSKYPEEYPKGIVDQLKFIGATVIAAISFPDPNYMYSHRQHAAHPVLLSSAESEKIMTLIGEFRSKGVVFQLMWENCAFFVYTVFSSVLGKKEEGGRISNFYKTHYHALKLAPPLTWIQQLSLKLGHKSGRKMVSGLFGAKRKLVVIEDGEKVKKSSHKTPFGQGGEINLPPLLHHRILTGEIPGTVHLGNS